MNDNTILIDKEAAKKHGIELDQHGFPTAVSLKAYDYRNNEKASHGQRATRLTEAGEKAAQNGIQKTE